MIFRSIFLSPTIKIVRKVEVDQIFFAIASTTL